MKRIKLVVTSDEDELSAFGLRISHVDLGKTLRVSHSQFPVLTYVPTNVPTLRNLSRSAVPSENMGIVESPEATDYHRSTICTIRSLPSSSEVQSRVVFGFTDRLGRSMSTVHLSFGRALFGTSH